MNSSYYNNLYYNMRCYLPLKYPLQGYEHRKIDFV